MPDVTVLMQAADDIKSTVEFEDLFNIAKDVKSVPLRAEEDYREFVSRTLMTRNYGRHKNLQFENFRDLYKSNIPPECHKRHLGQVLATTASKFLDYIYVIKEFGDNQDLEPFYIELMISSAYRVSLGKRSKKTITHAVAGLKNKERKQRFEEYIKNKGGRRKCVPQQILHTIVESLEMEKK